MAKEKKEEAKYKFPMGQAVEFYTSDLEEILGEFIYAFDNFFRLLESNEEDDSITEVVSVGRVLVENAYRKRDDAIHLIEENLGKITIDFASRQIGYGEGTFLGLNFVPVAKKEEPQSPTAK